MTLMQLIGDKDYITKSGSIIPANTNLVIPVDDIKTQFIGFDKN